MRPFGLFLAACLCGLLLYDRPSGRFPAEVLAAAAAPAPLNDPSLMNRPYPSQETRLQKLQHFQIASQLLEAQRQKVQDLEKEQNEKVQGVIRTMFAEGLSKDLRATWERMNDVSKQFTWRDQIDRMPLEKKEVLREQEHRNEELLTNQKQEYDGVLRDPRSADSKSLNLRFRALPWYNDFQKERELLDLFRNELNEARTSLKESR